MTLSASQENLADDAQRDGVRGYQRDAVEYALEFPPPFSCPIPRIGACDVLSAGDRAISNFARSLHPIQDFYSHSNWVETFGADRLVDDSLDEFPFLHGGDARFGAIIADDSLGGPGSLWVVRPAIGNSYPFDVLPTACTPGHPPWTCRPAIVSGRTDEPRFGLAISPVATFPNRCPANIRIFHDRDLAKDNFNGRLYPQARALATRQTTHEWCRFMNLVHKRHGASGIKQVCENWVGDVAGANSACPSLPDEARCKCSPVPDEIVAWWPGDGNTSDIIGGNDGLPVNGASFVVAEVKNGFVFDGIDDRISVNSADALKFGTDDLTIEAWIKSSPRPGVQAFVGKEQQSFPFPSIVFRLQDGLLMFAVTDCGTRDCGFGNSRQMVISPSRIDDNQFHHVAGVRDGTGYQLYIDGALVSTRLEPPRNADHDEPLLLGDQSSQVQSPYAGVLDELAFYRRALTAIEIHAIFAAGHAGKCK